MDAGEFKVWRESLNLTQQEVAQKFEVSRATVENWESGAEPITQRIALTCGMLAPRLRQENPDLGPVTLIYTDGPILADPNEGPRPPVTATQESHPTNAAAIARVQKLWGRVGFWHPFIIERSRRVLWNVIQLEEVVNGTDAGAPTLSNLLRRVVEEVRSTQPNLASIGDSKSAERNGYQSRVDELVIELETLSRATASGWDGYRKVDAIISELDNLGMRPRESLVSNILRALVTSAEIRLPQ
jgi:DNA-binding XRE family transcriptional regulator